MFVLIIQPAIHFFNVSPVCSPPPFDRCYSMVWWWWATLWHYPLTKVLLSLPWVFALLFAGVCRPPSGREITVQWYGLSATSCLCILLFFSLLNCWPLGSDPMPVVLPHSRWPGCRLSILHSFLTLSHPFFLLLPEQKVLRPFPPSAVMQTSKSIFSTHLVLALQSAVTWPPPAMYLSGRLPRSMPTPQCC